MMQSLPDARSQSFEELYGPPENFLEIEVGLPPSFLGFIYSAALLTLSRAQVKNPMTHGE
jgi:hypothetical protein